MNEKQSSLSLGTILTGLPVATAALYVLGISFYQGFVGAWGLEESLFPIAVDRTLFYGFFALMDRSAVQLVYFVFATEAIALVALAIVVLSTSARIRNYFDNKFKASPPKEEEREIKPPKAIAWFWQWTTYTFFFSIAVLLIVLGFLFAASLADRSGRETAAFMLKRIEAGRRSPIDLYLTGHAEPIKAHSILCSGTHCAFLIGKQSITYRLDQIERTVAHDVDFPKD
ncbi:hypothetical protein [Propionivibrio soli]|uniref:hypothetical protein n=1 Tax=Propionivibrio soli TaxID=2976531 RepID=UPI0021E9219E|nr:hypothetical protein [Propionivibrio soli]